MIPMNGDPNRFVMPEYTLGDNACVVGRAQLISC